MVKSITIFPEDTDVSLTNGVVSLLGALRLARLDIAHILIVGAETVATALVHGFSVGLPDAVFMLWEADTRVPGIWPPHIPMSQ